MPAHHTVQAHDQVGHRAKLDTRTLLVHVETVVRMGSQSHRRLVIGKVLAALVEDRNLVAHTDIRPAEHSLLLGLEHTCVVVVVDIRALKHLRKLYSNPGQNRQADGPAAVGLENYDRKVLVLVDVLHESSAEVDSRFSDRDVPPSVSRTQGQTRGRDR